MNKLDLIPIEIILLILEKIDRKDLYACALINKHMHMITNPLLWRSLRVTTSTASFTNFIAVMIGSHPPVGQYVKRLDVCYPVHLTNSQLMLLAKHVPLLEELNLYPNDHITNLGIIQLTHDCPKLKSLSLRNSRISHDALLSLVQHCPQLSRLCLTNCPYVWSTISPTLLTALPLDNFATYVKNMHLKTIDNVVSNVTALQDLTTLRIVQKRRHFPLIQRILTTTTATSAAANNTYWPHLTDLYLTRCDLVTDQQVITFIKAHPLLKSFHIGSATLTIAVLNAITTFLPDITSVGLDYNTDIIHQAVRQMIWDCPLLTYASLYRCLIQVEHFPEADSHCRLSPTSYYLSNLDKEAILNIRLAPQPTENNNNNNN